MIATCWSTIATEPISKYNGECKKWNKSLSLREKEVDQVRRQLLYSPSERFSLPQKVTRPLVFLFSYLGPH
jgi:hypothetical protein